MIQFYFSWNVHSNEEERHRTNQHINANSGMKKRYKKNSIKEIESKIVATLYSVVRKGFFHEVASE